MELTVKGLGFRVQNPQSIMERGREHAEEWSGGEHIELQQIRVTPTGVMGFLQNAGATL